MNKKSVGIVTFHFSKNYGSALQCYALYKLLFLYGYKPKVINYCPSYHTISYNSYNTFHDFYENRDDKSWLYIALKTPIKNIEGLLKVNRNRKNKKFSNFISNNIKLTKPYKYVKSIDDTFDIYISGSDQIWNYKCVKDKEYGGVYDKAYFLSFANNKKKIAYAVSAQHGEIRTDLDKDILGLINAYDSIFTREVALTNTLHLLGRTDASTVLDPTLLLEKRYYESVEASIPHTMKNYILVYNLPGANSSLLKNVIEIVARKTAYKVIDISPLPYVDINSKKVRSCGPAEFLAYVHNANYILTDSFHCIIFALIFKKDFNCVLREKDDERIKGILSLCELNDKLVKSINDEIDFDSIDYDMVWKLIEPERQRSIALLFSALEKK